MRQAANIPWRAANACATAYHLHEAALNKLDPIYSGQSLYVKCCVTLDVVERPKVKKPKVKKSTCQKKLNRGDLKYMGPSLGYVERPDNFKNEND